MADQPIQYRIKKKDQPGPNCLWTISRPEIGMVGEGYIFLELSKSVRKWRNANGIPTGLDFENELENAICAEYPNECTSEDPRAPIRIEHITTQDVTHGTEVMIRHLLNNRKVVSTEEANRRAGICANCRLNVPFPGGCQGSLCGRLLDIVKWIVGDQRTSQYDALHMRACYICKCHLEPAVWLPAEVQTAALTDFQKEQFKQVESFCWKAQAIAK